MSAKSEGAGPASQWGSRPHRGWLAVVTMVLALSLIVVSRPALAAMPSYGSARAAAAAAPVDLRIAPGRIGPLRMGMTTTQATRLRMLKYGPCGWGPDAYIRFCGRGGGNAFFYTPLTIRHGRVLAYWVDGSSVRTTKGLKQGDRLSAMRRLYPHARQTGTQSSVYFNGRWQIYSVGSARAGWLDIFVVYNDDAGRLGRVDFFIVRDGNQRLLKPHLDGC